MSEFLIRRLVFLAARPLTAPTCPFDGSELDLHFHGGASCPQCGHEFEIGQGDRLLPSDATVEEEAAKWPDTIPFTSGAQNAPVSSPEAPGGPHSDSWGTVSSSPNKDDFPLEEDEEWKPTIPTLDEMVEIERWHRPAE